MPSVDALADDLLAGRRPALARAISLVESSNPAHTSIAADLLARIMPHTGESIRVGITGIPGVGKSTFIECLGTMLTTGALAPPRKVAVLAIDPSSTRTGGSILGDKTRMARLSADPNAFIRPSPTSGTLGGVARKTRESMLLCEAAGFDVVLVETVGVGQSETVVVEMTDFFLALMLPGAGDELQGIKRGLLEMADLVAVNKADGENAKAARRAAAEHAAAIRCMSHEDENWIPPVMTCSARTGEGVAEIWRALEGRIEDLRETSILERRRHEQLLRWLKQLVTEELVRAFETDDRIVQARRRIDLAVRAGDLAPSIAARELLGIFLHNRSPQPITPDPI